jgi:hypothetical protein
VVARERQDTRASEDWLVKMAQQEQKAQLDLRAPKAPRVRMVPRVNKVYVVIQVLMALMVPQGNKDPEDIKALRVKMV